MTRFVLRFKENVFTNSTFGLLEFYVFRQSKGNEIGELVTTATCLHMEKVPA